MAGEGFEERVSPYLTRSEFGFSVDNSDVFYRVFLRWGARAHEQRKRKLEVSLRTHDSLRDTICHNSDATNFTDFGSSIHASLRWVPCWYGKTTVNRPDAGSIPAAAACQSRGKKKVRNAKSCSSLKSHAPSLSTEVIRPDEEPVSKTGAGETPVVGSSPTASVFVRDQHSGISGTRRRRDTDGRK